jgi:hypothetical protein
MPTAIVPVKNAIASKINWLQFVSLIVTFLTGVVGAFNLDAATALKVTAGVAMFGQVATMVIRTFYSPSVVGPSLGGQ